MQYNKWIQSAMRNRSYTCKQLIHTFVTDTCRPAYALWRHFPQHLLNNKVIMWQYLDPLYIHRRLNSYFSTNPREQLGTRSSL